MIQDLTNIVQQLDRMLDAMELNPIPLTAEFYAIGAARISLIEAIVLMQEATADSSFEAGVMAIQSVVKGSK
jgi:hypothetical protein